ncbi:MAG: fructose-6-phosphate aldolase [Clostridiales bacterium]|nr:fructose-6-phosphate aldolase [Clostridiales bacterium]
MKLLIDDADIAKIKEIYRYYPIDGVTTNPSILAKSGRQPYDVLAEIRSFIGAEADFHVQVIARTAEGMVEDAHRIVKELGQNTFVKIPSVPEGFRAMQILTSEGIRTTGTAVYTPMQAYLAAKSGASFVAPYINRIDNMGFDGIHVAKEIQDIFRSNGMATQILAASFKNSQQVLELCRYGVGSATVSPDVINSFLKNAAIDAAVDAFVADFEGLTGKGKTMATC